MSEHETQITKKDTIVIKKPSPHQTKLISAIVALVVVLGIGFVAGMQYQKGKAKAGGSMQTAAGPGGAAGLGTINGTGRAGRLGGRFGGAFGVVSAVSTTSITVKNQRTSADQTFAVTSSTTVTDNGSASTIGAIKVGDNVVVRADTADATKAASIMLNPQAGGFGGGQAGGGAPQQAN